MAIPCESCGSPVHEQVVVCPHCANDTGVPADPIATSEISLLPELTTEPTRDNRSLLIDAIAPIGRVVSAVVVTAAKGLADDDDEPLPRAIAREKPK